MYRDGPRFQGFYHESQLNERERTEMILNIEPGLIHQSDSAKSFHCTKCDTWLRTHYEGDGKAKLIQCGGKFGNHTIEIVESQKSNLESREN